MRRLAPALSFFVLACTQPEMDLGADPDVVFWADNELGELPEWTTPASLRGMRRTYGGSTLEAVPRADAPSGDHVLKLEVPPHQGCCVGAYVSREGAWPVDAYYGATFRFATAAVGRPYWSILKLGEVLFDDPGNRGERLLWEIWVEEAGDGGLALRLYRHDVLATTTPGQTFMQPTVRPGTWVRVELRVRAATDAAGLVELWQDGMLVASATGTPTIVDPTLPRRFMVASSSEDTPALSLEADAAFVSLRRLGPAFRAR